jgi:hypothetical protein
VLFHHQRMPGRDRRGMNEGSGEHLPPPPTYIPRFQQHTWHGPQDAGSPWQGEQLRSHESSVSHDNHEARPGVAVVGIELAQGKPQTSFRVGDPLPFVGLRRWPILERVARAGAE